MSRIVRAVNAMILNKNSLDNVISKKSELFFEYLEKYKWSISKAGDEYSLYYYNEKKDLKILSELPGYEFENIQMVSYRTKEMKTLEATETFRDLYQILKEKVFGVDSILDDIIDGDGLPF